MKKLQLEIINRSNWPDPFIKVVCNWMAKKTKLDNSHSYVNPFETVRWKYTFLLRSYSKLYTFAGNANGRQQTIRINRKYKPNNGFPHKFKDHRYSWSKEYTLNNRIEVFVFLMAHETYHSLTANGVESHNSDKRANKEFECDDFAFKIVQLFNKEWAYLKEKIKKEFKREKKRVEKHIKWKKDKKSPIMKLERARNNLENWENKLRFAQNKIKKYQRDVRYYEKRVT